MERGPLSCDDTAWEPSTFQEWDGGRVLVPPGNTTLGGWPALKSWKPVRCAPTALGPGPHLAIRAGSGKSVPIRRESHTVDKAAMVLQEKAQLST